MSKAMKLARLVAQVTVALVTAIALIFTWALVASWLAYAFGFQNGDGNSSFYLFWSGAGSDIGELGIIWGVLLYYRNTNCKRAWCPFLGNHEFTDPDDGITRKLCWYHHPDVQHKTLKPHHIEAINTKRQQQKGDDPC